MSPSSTSLTGNEGLCPWTVQLVCPVTSVLPLRLTYTAPRETRLLLAGHLQPQALLEGSVFVDGVITFPMRQSAKYA